MAQYKKHERPPVEVTQGRKDPTDLSTREAQEFLNAKWKAEGHDVNIAVDTVKHYCLRGVFKTAYQVDLGRPGAMAWFVPKAELESMPAPNYRLRKTRKGPRLTKKKTADA